MVEGGVETLYKVYRKKPNPKNRIEEATKAAVIAYATALPTVVLMNGRGIHLAAS